MSEIGERQKAIGIVLIVMVAAAGFFLYQRPHTASSTSTVSSSSLYTPNLGYTATSSGPMLFAGNDQSISYGTPSSTNFATQQSDLTMLYSLGVTCIRTDIGFGPWLTNDINTQQLVIQTMQAIKSNGHCLILADASSETYRHGGQLAWSQFKTAWYQRASTLAGLFHPDYYIVVKEPGWYAAMVSDASTNPQFQSVSDWLNLTQGLTNLVHTVSPTTIVGVSIAADSLNGANGPFYAQYLNQVQGSVAFIGFDIYTGTGQTSTQNYLAQNHPSKPVWVAEDWPTPTPSGIASNDALGLKGQFLFAQQIGAAAFIPFYTDQFEPGYQPPLTQSGSEFQNIIKGQP